MSSDVDVIVLGSGNAGFAAVGAAHNAGKSAVIVESRDIGIGMFKSLVFGILVVTIACNTGLNDRGGAEGVGLATTRSVVLSLLAVFVANAALTTLFFF